TPVAPSSNKNAANCMSEAVLMRPPKMKNREQAPGSSRMIPITTINAVRQPLRGSGGGRYPSGGGGGGEGGGRSLIAAPSQFAGRRDKPRPPLRRGCRRSCHRGKTGCRCRTE